MGKQYLSCKYTINYMDKMKVAPRSKHFEDIYFSESDGLKETQHVFIEGNGLPRAWSGKKRFVIAETGFGTGLNFLTVSRLFQEILTDGALDYISFEKFPLASTEIADFLNPWKEEFPDDLERLVEVYPLRIPGFHKIFFRPDITLTLIFDDINKAITEIITPVDCWFLDGFKPAVNPDMWTETLFENMARLSAADASFATFTAAGSVRRGLQKAGFHVEKVKGFGSKRDMLKGSYKGKA